MRKKRSKRAKPAPTKMTSIRLNPQLVARLEKRADALGIGWQTLIKMLLTKYQDAEL